MPTRDEKYAVENQEPVSKRDEAFRGEVLGRKEPNVPEGVRERLAVAEEMAAELGGMERTDQGLSVPRGVGNRQRE